MNGGHRRAWVRAALLFGVAYFLVGRLFAGPPDNVRVWRAAAWLVSGVVYAAHVGYEHFGLRSSPRSTALALAVAGMMHSLSTESAVRPAWLLALVLWPAFTAIPAFLGALLIATVLSRLARSPDAE